MKAIKVKKDVLLAKVRENRDAHRAVFEEAVAGYQKQAETMLREHIKRIKSGELVEVFVRLPRPVEHTKDYDRVIAMLDMDLGDEIELEEHDFQMYVQDDWDWKGTWAIANASYSATATAIAREYGSAR